LTWNSIDVDTKKPGKKVKKPKKNTKSEDETKDASSWLTYVIPVVVLTAAGVIAFVAYKFLQNKKDKK
jgi:fatty acid desaturase